MRKFITFAFLFMLFSMVSGSVFAGKYEDCVDFKGDKRLYGLCNAYQNALFNEDEDAMADIFRNWEKYVDENGEPQLPNHDYGSVECPCWTAEILADATAGKQGVFCASSATHDEANYFNNAPFFEAGLFDEASGYCVMELGYASVALLISAEEAQLCRAGVQVLQDSTDESGNFVFPPCLEF